MTMVLICSVHFLLTEKGLLQHIKQSQCVRRGVSEVDCAKILPRRTSSCMGPAA